MVFPVEKVYVNAATEENESLVITMFYIKYITCPLSLSLLHTHSSSYYHIQIHTAVCCYCCSLQGPKQFSKSDFLKKGIECLNVIN
jgi:hypothetical protein